MRLADRKNGAEWKIRRASQLAGGKSTRQIMGAVVIPAEGGVGGWGQQLPVDHVTSRARVPQKYGCVLKLM